MSTFKVNTLVTWDGLKSVAVGAIYDGLLAIASKFDKAGGDISGDVSLTGTARRLTGDLSNSTASSRLMVQTSTANAKSNLRVIPSGTGNEASLQAGNSSDANNQSLVSVGANETEASLSSGAVGSAPWLPLSFYTNASPSLRVNTDGSVLALRAGIGYGAGACGTVTQNTSKSTPVTLDKPSGRITTNSEAMTANRQVSFVLYNSTIEVGDQVIVNGSSAANYDYRVGLAAAGGVTIFIRNTATSTLSDALTLDFKVIKGSLS